MSVQQKIDRCLEDTNYPEAISLFELHKKTVRGSPQWFLRIAKVYYSLAEYEKVLGILESVRWDSPAVNYETRMLEFKCNYLLGTRKTRSLLQELQQLVSADHFLPQHRDAVQEFKTILDYRDHPKNKIELKAEGVEYERLAKRENEAGACGLDCFSVYVVSQRWMTQWRKYVYLVEHELERNSPGTLSQLDILDHPFAYLHDPMPRKDYTNRFLLNPADYVIVSKECWNFLSKRYGGVPIVRYNICNFDKPNESFSEVSLKLLTVAKYQRPEERHVVQISRRDCWKGLEEKLIRCWGAGRLWKFYNKKHYRVNPSSILEEEETSGFELIFELQEKGKWRLANPDPEVTNKCANCDKTVGVKFCQCRKVKYCSKSCQKKDRARHERICQSTSLEFEMSSLVERYDLSSAVQYEGRKGLVGLKNIGNSCYMNTGIQCLSNTKQLTDYFLASNFTTHLNSTNPLGSSGMLACAYAKLIRDLWTCRNSEISPWDFKKAFSKFSPQFSGFGQHDSQEFIAALLDGLHQDTNLVKKKPVVPETDFDGKDDTTASHLANQNYLKRNQSFISDLIGGQFKSTLRCPTPGCNRVAVTFDHFMSVSLPILQPVEADVFFVPKELKAHVEKVVLGLSLRQTVGDIVARICKIFEVSTSDSIVKVLEISLDFEIVQEIDYKQPATNLINTKVKDSYIFFYEVKRRISDNKQLYTVEFTTDLDTKKETISFPRLMMLSKSLDYEAAEEAVWTCLSEYNKNPNITQPKHLFKLTLSADQIRVSLKEDIKLRTYKESKKHAADNSGGEELTIEDCLNNFCKDQKLDQQDAWYCSKCKQHVRANKKMDIYKTGKILLMALKRFKSDRKIKTEIKFPLRLNLGPYILSNVVCYAGNPAKKQMEYELYAIVNHFGTLLSGHYTAFCRNFLDSKWYEFNDSKVESIKESEIITRNAYALFYRRKE